MDHEFLISSFAHYARRISIFSPSVGHHQSSMGVTEIINESMLRLQHAFIPNCYAELCEIHILLTR